MPIDFDPWGPMIGLLFEDGSSDYILGVLQRIGIGGPFNLTEQESYSHKTRNRAYKRHVDAVYSQLDQSQRKMVAENLAIEISEAQRGPEKLDTVLERIGWRFDDGTFSLSGADSRPASSKDTVTASSVTPPMTLRRKAHVLLTALSERSAPGERPVDDVTQLRTELDSTDVKRALCFLKDNGLVNTFSLPLAARINSKGVEAIENESLLKDGALSSNLQTESKTTQVVRKSMSNKVFVVHGHDKGAREAVARYLEKLGLEAIILQEQPNQGRTIIEKVEANRDVGFAVVLLTPDDMGFKVGEVARPRPRQNVVVELGYFFGYLGREKVCALASTDTMELPTDFAGVVWEPFDAHGAWKQVLVRELIAAGFKIDPSKTI